MDTDIYVVQTRRNGVYVNRITTNNRLQAHLVYNAINIGNGYRKRLCLNGKVIKKFFS